MSRPRETDCTCPFVEETGKKGETSKIGLIYGQDPPTCLRRCREEYLRKISSKPDISPDACNVLLTSTNRQQFHPLYWCDSSLCGVWIDPDGGLEQDPNVGLIINTCQNIGYFTIKDPGPPPENYSCSFCDGGSAPDPDPGQKLNPSATSSTSTTADSDATRPTSKSATSQSTIQATATPTSVVGPSAGDAASSITGRLSTGAKVAIGVCSAVALVALSLLILLLLRHRRKHKLFDLSGKNSLRIDHDFSRPTGGSPTPLISPISPSDPRPPLTPPLRLRDRKLLPSILKTSARSRSPPIGAPFDEHGFSTDHKSPFPVSPICAPTTNKLEPRQAKVTGLHKLSSPRSPPPVSFSMPRSSLSSFATSGTVTANSSLRNEVMATTTNGTGVSTIAITDAADPPPPTPPTSPSRPSRPHESPLIIPDLVTGPVNLGPPPSRGLPSPPPLPVRSSANVMSWSSIFSGRDPDFPKHAAAAARANKAKDCNRGNHDSWGSWTTSGDDGLGLAGQTVSDEYTDGIGIALTKTHSSEVFPGPLDDQGRSSHDTQILHDGDVKAVEESSQ